MLIDIIKDLLVIDGTNFKSNQISQLNFWEFKKDAIDGKYKSTTKRIEILLPKLINYLNKEEISYNLSPTANEFLLQYKQSIDSFLRIKAYGKEFKDGIVDFEKYNEFKTFIINNIPRKLKEHQLKAGYHLFLIRNGANFSVPGSGKTSVVLTVYEKLRFEGKVNVLFVVGPPSCFSPWRTEFELTFGHKADSRILAGGGISLRKSEYFSTKKSKAELYLTTYQTLLNDQDDVINFFSQVGIDVFLVIDEAHYIKQLDGSWANAVLHISEYSKYRCVLSGTPLPKSYTDIFNMFDFLWPNNSPLDEETKINIKLLEEKNESRLIQKTLENLIGPLFYRVRKSDLGLKPPVFHPPIMLSMNKYENIIYYAIEKKIRMYSQEDYLKNIDLIYKLKRGRIIRLRQSVSYISLLSSAVEDYAENLIKDETDLSNIIYSYDKLELPAKLEYLLKFIERLQKQNLKIVIWSHFIGTLELIVKHLKNKGYYCKLIYGKTPTEQTSIEEEESRESIRKEFVDPKSGLDILVVNPAACAESISLHKTCYNAIYYDLSYNCAQYLQSLDRIHRVGGSEFKQANYYFLQYKNTIDQDIKYNLDAKSKKMYEIIDKKYSIYSLNMFEVDDETLAYDRLFR